jgi:hypothetical protein
MRLSSSPRSRSLELPDVIVEGSLCRLRVWTELEWSAVQRDQRPRTCAHVPDLGWVGAVPDPCIPGPPPDPIGTVRPRADRRRLRTTGSDYRLIDPRMTVNGPPARDGHR